MEKNRYFSLFGTADFDLTNAWLTKEKSHLAVSIYQVTSLLYVNGNFRGLVFVYVRQSE